MLLFNLKYLLVHLTHNTFETLIIYQFPLATMHKLFKSIKAVSFCKSLRIPHVPAVFCIKRVLTSFAKFTENY